MRCQAKVLALALLAFTAGSLDVRAQSWRKHVYKPDGFEIEFPGEITLHASQISEEAKARIVRSTNYIKDGGTFKYLVAATLTKAGVDFEKGVETGFGSYKCQTLRGKTALSVQGGKGREVRGAGCAGGLQVDARYYMTGNWFYQVIAQYKANSADERAARRFVESFKVIGQ